MRIFKAFLMPYRRIRSPNLLGSIGFSLILSYFLLTSCQPKPDWTRVEQATENAYPAERWAKVDDPNQLGWSSARLAQVHELVGKIGTTALMIVEDGIVVDAWGDVTSKHNLHSVHKSILSALIGIAVDRGQIDLAANLESLGIDDTEPSLTLAEKQATVGDLIKARSGIYHPALYEAPVTTMIKPRRGSHPPGTFWYYNEWDFNALGTIYEQQSKQKAFEAVAGQIARPLQMQDFEASDGRYGTGTKSIHAAYAVTMTARDLARFALLYLRQGYWRGEQIVPANWVIDSTTPHSDIGPDRGYGYMWWTGAGEGLFPNLHIRERGFYAAGWGGQFAAVIPYLDLVVVHQVDTMSPGRRPTQWEIGRLLWQILAAKGEVGLGPDPSLEAAAGMRLARPDLRRLLMGTTMTGVDWDGTPWRVTFGEDGKLSIRWGFRDELEDSGAWRLEGDSYCRRWSTLGYGDESCYAVLKTETDYGIYELQSGTFSGAMLPLAH